MSRLIAALKQLDPLTHPEPGTEKSTLVNGTPAIESHCDPTQIAPSPNLPKVNSEPSDLPLPGEIVSSWNTTPVSPPGEPAAARTDAPAAPNWESNVVQEEPMLVVGEQPGANDWESAQQENTPVAAVVAPNFIGSERPDPTPAKVPPERIDDSPVTPRIATVLDQRIETSLRSGNNAPEYRQIAVGISSAIAPDVPSSVMLSGVDDSEQVAVTLVHIGMILAEDGCGDILLVDADLTNRNLSECMGCPSVAGLGDFVQGDQWHQCVRGTANPRLHFLAAGRSRVTRLSTWAPHFATAIAQMKDRYRIILVDGGTATQPIAQACGRYCDATYLLVEIGRTELDQMQRATRRLRTAGSRLLGCIAVQ